MDTIPLTPALSAAKQPQPEDFAALAAAGVRTIVNNRPDGEDPGQLTAADAARIAASAGLAYHHLPVTGASLSRSDVERFGQIVETAPGPVLAHCRSGTRSTTLWVLHEVLAGRMARDAVLPFGQERGLDLTGALAWLDRETGSPR